MATDPASDSADSPAVTAQTWQALMAAVARFRDDRDWAQFHTPKNLAAAIAIEAAELQERFLWKTDQEITETLADPAGRAGVVEELADVFMFALLMADRLEIDVAAAITSKLADNARKYPVALARGNARKYTELAADGSSGRRTAAPSPHQNR